MKLALKILEKLRNGKTPTKKEIETVGRNKRWCGWSWLAFTTWELQMTGEVEEHTPKEGRTT